MGEPPKPITRLAGSLTARRKARAALLALLSMLPGLAACTILLLELLCACGEHCGSYFGRWFLYVLPAVGLVGTFLSAWAFAAGLRGRGLTLSICALAMNAGPLLFWMLVVFRVVKVTTPLDFA